MEKSLTFWFLPRFGLSLRAIYGKQRTLKMLAACQTTVRNTKNQRFPKLLHEIFLYYISEDGWTIHGIWPSATNGKHPFFCNKSLPFDEVQKIFIHT